MKKWILGLLCALALAACASIGGGAQTPAQQYAAARLDLNSALASMLAYASKPRCDAVVKVACSRQDVIDRSFEAARIADAALDQAGVALKGGGLDPAAAIRAALEAVAALQAYLLRELPPATAAPTV